MKLNQIARQFSKFWLFVACFSFIALAQATGETVSTESREYYLKAAFMRYIAQFTEWPSSALPKGNINICMLGLVPSFEGVSSINGKTVNERTLTLNKILKADDAKNNCQILFVTKTEEENLSSIFTAIKGLPILTLGDMDNFASKGGDMNFYIANNRLAIMANLKAVKASNLAFNPRMLKLITVVPQVD